MNITVKSCDTWCGSSLCRERGCHYQRIIITGATHMPKHHKQMIQGSIPSMKKLRTTTERRHTIDTAIGMNDRREYVEEAIADIAPTEWPKIAEGVEVPAWATGLRRALGRAIMRVAAWFRRRMT